MSLPWLQARSHFSLGESLAEPEALVAAAKEAGLSSILLCDTMSVSGMPELFSAAKKAGIKPMIGVRLRLIDELHREKKTKKPEHRPYFIRALILDQRGWDATLGLLSTAFQEDHFYMVPRLLLSDVIDAYRGGGAALALGEFSGALGHARAQGVVGAAQAAGIPLYADLNPIPTPLAIRQAKEALLLQDQGIPTLVSPPALYADPGQADSLDMMRSISSNFPWDELSARHPYRAHVVRGVKPLLEETLSQAGRIYARYGAPTSGKPWSDYTRAALMTTKAFPDLVSFTWDKQEPSLPVMAPDEFAQLTQLCVQGWKDRFSAPVFGHVPTNLEPYKARLKYELAMIKKLGFSAYFLLVAQIVDWAKGQGIRVGPGRGSVGGSLIAYLMNITDVDPLRFGLLFERFINPERQDLPDADLDFASLRREEVVDYIIKTFGEAHVAGVVNYNTMQAAGALKDVCRMLGVDEIMAFGKLVPKEHGQSWSLEDALAEVPELASFAAKHPEVIRHAEHLEGKIRSFGKHAAGIIVAGVPIRERAVIERRNGAQVINWDKRLAEDFGLVKMDVLGLSTLDMLDISIQHIKRMHGHTLDLLSIPLDDPKTLEAFGRGETVGIFQFESAGMRRLLRSLAEQGTLTFDDLAIATALYRPGPMDSGLMDDFVKIRQGRKLPHYDHPSMEDALRETQGIMVYQEQVMQVARDFAGYTMPESDELRKIMGKKLKDKMELQKDKFVAGAVSKHGVDPGLAGEVFDKIGKFAAYGFNKSHAVAYSLISYQTMFVKVNHAAEFWSGVLSMVKDDRRDTILADMTRMGIKLLPPDVNQSGVTFAPLNANVVLMPFSAVKGISERSAALIVEAREEKGAFTSLKDFEGKVAGRSCNSGQREKLNLVGAFARIEPGQEPADHHSRRRDQSELLQGLIADAVIVDRGVDLTATSLVNLTQLIEGWKACTRCELQGLCHPKPWITGPAKAMIVLDGPGFKEEAHDEMGHGGHADAIAEALRPHGMGLDDLYITGLVKSVKPEKGKGYSTKTLAECPTWLDDEIRILKPPVIALMGSASFKRFFPGLKGGINEHVGKVYYDRDRDLNILVGMNPNAIFFAPEKQEILDKVMEKLVELLPSY